MFSWTPGLGMAAPAASPSPPPSMPADLLARAAAARKPPTFCEIPPAPENVRTPQAFKALVVNVRLAGAWLLAQSAPDSFTLTGTEGFAAAARAQATPPPPMSSPNDPGTNDFVAAARGRALPPVRN